MAIPNPVSTRAAAVAGVGDEYTEYGICRRYPLSYKDVDDGPEDPIENDADVGGSDPGDAIASWLGGGRDADRTPTPPPDVAVAAVVVVVVVVAVVPDVADVVVVVVVVVVEEEIDVFGDEEEEEGESGTCPVCDGEAKSS